MLSFSEFVESNDLVAQPAVNAENMANIMIALRNNRNLANYAIKLMSKSPTGINQHEMEVITRLHQILTSLNQTLIYIKKIVGEQFYEKVRQQKPPEVIDKFDY